MMDIRTTHRGTIMAALTEKVTHSDFCQPVMLNSTLHRESNNTMVSNQLSANNYQATST